MTETRPDVAQTDPTVSTVADGSAGPGAIEELAGRLFAAGVGAMELGNAYLGIRLGLYAALADAPATADELAARAGVAPRYAVEWLQAQAVSGLARIAGDDVRTARFALAEGVREVLVDQTHPAYLGGLPAAVAAANGVLPRLAEVFRTGEPLPYPEYGPDAVSAQAALNRPAYANSLVADWLPQIPEVHARLQDAGNPAVVGDFGCGAGWAAIALATALPHLRVLGLDNDEASVATARRNVLEHQVADRVQVEVRDLGLEPAADPGSLDVVFLFECVHDMPRPVEVLAQARRALRPGGSVIVMDENAAESLTAPGDPVERFFANASTLWCLPQGLVGADPEPVGTLIRPATMRSLAERAGFGQIEVLGIEHPFWRFYRLAA